MVNHITDAYKDGDHTWITYCKVCGEENPHGECPGKFIPNRDRKEKTVDAPKSLE